jgi:hypothetical protein
MAGCRQFGGKGHQPDVATGRALQVLEGSDLWSNHVPGIVGTVESRLRREPRPFQVITAKGRAYRRIPGPQTLKLCQLAAECFGGIGDERGEKPPRLMIGQRPDGPAQLCGGKAGLLKIHAGEPVDLDIEKG